MRNTNTTVDMKNQQVSRICGPLVPGTGGRVSPVWSSSPSVNLCICCLVLTCTCCRDFPRKPDQNFEILNMTQDLPRLMKMSWKV